MRLDANIDMSGRTWRPIYIQDGVFDGNGYTISGLQNISHLSDWDTEGTHHAFICHLGQYATLKNLTLTNAKVEKTGDHAPGTGEGTRGDAAAFVFDNEGTIENCTLKDSTVTANDIAGGIASFSRGHILNCTVQNSTITSNDIAGGIVCYNEGAIEGCKTSGTVSGARYAGGICAQTLGSGWVNASIMDCVNEATVRGYQIGGIADYVNGDIVNCVNKGALQASDPDGTSVSMGGIACSVGSGSSIINCRNEGTFSQQGPSTPSGSVGGIVCDASNATIVNCYNSASFVIEDDGEVSSWHVGGIAAGVGSWDEYTPLVVERCVNTGDFSGTLAGGIFARVTMSRAATKHIYTPAPVFIRDCYNTGDIGSLDPGITSGWGVDAGGIIGAISFADYNVVGYPEHPTFVLENCYSSGNTASPLPENDWEEGYGCDGGIVGKIVISEEGGTSKISFNNLVAAGASVTDGRVFGMDITDMPFKSVNTYANSSMQYSNDFFGESYMRKDAMHGESRPMSDLHSQSFYESIGWDFSSVWKMSSGGLPVLQETPGHYYAAVKVSYIGSAYTTGQDYKHVFVSLSDNPYKPGAKAVFTINKPGVITIVEGSFTYTPKGQSPQKVSYDSATGEYYFIMPAADVTVNV